MRLLRACALLILALLGGGLASRSSPAELLTRRHWGVNIHSASWGPASAELLRTAFTAIRQDFAWDSVEKQRGVYDWSIYETLLEQLGPGVVPYLLHRPNGCDAPSNFWGTFLSHNYYTRNGTGT